MPDLAIRYGQASDGIFFGQCVDGGIIDLPSMRSRRSMSCPAAKLPPLILRAIKVERATGLVSFGVLFGGLHDPPVPRATGPFFSLPVKLLARSLEVRHVVHQPGDARRSRCFSVLSFPTFVGGFRRLAPHERAVG